MKNTLFQIIKKFPKRSHQNFKGCVFQVAKFLSQHFDVLTFSKEPYHFAFQEMLQEFDKKSAFERINDNSISAPKGEDHNDVNGEHVLRYGILDS